LAKVPGKGWAWTAFTVGLGTSITCNVAHTFLRPDGASASWQPHPLAVALAGVWPVLVLLAIEVIARVPWPEGWAWWAVRYGGLTAVAGIAALLSYQHMYGLIRYFGEPRVSAALAPLAIDGLMAICAAALLAIGRLGRSERPAEATESVPVGDAVAEPPAPVLEAPVVPDEPQQLTASQNGHGAELERRANVRSKDRARNARAVQAYRDSVTAGTPLTGPELAKRYRMSAEWARARIRDAKAT
jgi:hypothetical protein